MAAMIVSILALCISVCSLILAMRREAPYFSFDVSEELSTCTDFEEYALRISNVGGGDAYEIRLSGELEFDNRKIVCLHPGESSVVHVARRIGHDGGWLLIDRRIELIENDYPPVTLHWRTRPFTLSRHRLRVRLQDCDRLVMPDKEGVFHFHYMRTPRRSMLQRGVRLIRLSA